LGMLYFILYAIEKVIMKVKVNGTLIELHNGARVKDAILKYYSEQGRRIPKKIPSVEDRYGNKIADDGELIILAPGVRKFGEDDENDRLIRKYGYVGRKKVLELTKENEDLQNNLSVAAHLIHGSSDDRFSITYAVNHLTKSEVENANFKYMPLSEALKKYNPDQLKDGYNTLEDGEEIFYISNPALGLWADKNKF